VASLASSVLLFYLYFLTDVKWLGRFFVGYFVSLIPFLMVNGILTAWPVVEYNDAENLGIRIFIDGWANIPIDDTIYCLLLLLMNVSLYHYFENRAGVNLPLTKD
jgi:lycopene cyclase domain-containing protein